MTTRRRSIFADKLLDFPDIAFVDEAAFQHRGRWGEFFRQRIGGAFNGRIIFEVGCFDAAYLVRLAAKHPQTGFVGLDWKYKALYDGAQRVAGAGLRNIALLRGRAQDVRKIFTDGEVDEIWVFHPDPCDGPRELHNRLIAQPFLLDVHHVLRDESSTLALKTDHPGYYQWVLGLFDLPAHEKTLARFSVEACSADFWNDAGVLAHTCNRAFAGENTTFEARFIKKRMPIYYVEMRKRKQERRNP
ncbi:MAG: hypothetical protein ABIP55_06815 [Tepidisphaeraceae bacterium]